MITPLTIDDIPELIHILETEARVEMKYPERASVAFMTNVWSSLIASGQSMAFVAKKGAMITGFLLGLQGPDPYSGRAVAIEQLWYIRKAHAGSSTAIRLLTAFMDDARVRGCCRVLMGDWQIRGGVDLSRIYKRFGLEPLERYFAKELCQ